MRSMGLQQVPNDMPQHSIDILPVSSMYQLHLIFIIFNNYCMVVHFCTIWVKIRIGINKYEYWCKCRLSWWCITSKWNPSITFHQIANINEVSQARLPILTVMDGSSDTLSSSQSKSIAPIINPEHHKIL